MEYPFLPFILIKMESRSEEDGGENRNGSSGKPQGLFPDYNAPHDAFCRIRQKGQDPRFAPYQAFLRGCTDALFRHPGTVKTNSTTQ